MSPETGVPRPDRVIVGMSGGVDSSVASFLLQQQGYTVIGLTLLVHDGGQAAVADAAAVCRHLNLTHVVVDARKTFREQIIRSFVDAWLSGLTPNPCVRCNQDLKFRILMAEADRLDCAYLATGHYAAVRRIETSGRLALTRTLSGQKDQTYFLYRLSQEQLARLLFPLQDKNKADIRRQAAAAGLSGDDNTLLAHKPDSQDICFIPQQDYLAFLRQEIRRSGSVDAARLLEPGVVLDRQGREIGCHKGLLAYTIGQRKGFEVRTTERLFVLAKDPAANTLTVGPYDDLMRRHILVRDIVYSGLPCFGEGYACLARIRSSAQPAACCVFPQADGRLLVRFDQPVAAPAPGQSCVFYGDNLILAGGLIDAAQPEPNGVCK